MDGERTPLYERTIVSKVIFEREQEVGRAVKVLADETGVPSDVWFQARNETIKSGASPFVVDQIIIDRGRKTAEKANMRETQLMTPVPIIQSEPEKKVETTQETPVSGAKPGKIIAFRTLKSGDLARRLRAATTSEVVVRK